MFILPRTTTRSRSLLTSTASTTRLILPALSTQPKTQNTIKAHLHTTRISLSTNNPAGQQPPVNTQHTSDTYSKDIDTTPVEDTSVFRVDPSSELVQKPHEPPSGAWSRVGVSAQYQSVQGKMEGVPYEPKGGSGARYGSRMSWAEDKGRETSGPEEGPAEGSSKGRK